MNPQEFEWKMELNENAKTYNFIVNKNFTGTRIDVFLANYLNSTSRKQIQIAIETAQITVNSKKVTKNYIIKNCDAISIASNKLIPKEEFLSQTTSDDQIPKRKIDKTYSSSNQVIVVKGQKDFEKDNLEKLNRTNNLIIQKNVELQNINVHLGSVEKKLFETSDQLSKSEQKLNIETNKNVSLGNEITELKQMVASFKDQLTKLNTALQVKEKEIQKLQLERSREEDSLQAEKTRSIGKYDAWNREKFETLQANTQQQLVEYNKILAHYQNEIDRFRGKKTEEKTVEEGKEDEYSIPPEEKTFSVGEYDTWSQEKFEELQENTKRQFHEYDLLLERLKKQLAKHSGKEHIIFQSKDKMETDTETIEVLSIVEKIERIISDFIDKLIPIIKEKKPKKPKEPNEVLIDKKDKFIIKLTAWSFIVIILFLLSSVLLKSFWKINVMMHLF